MTQKNIKDLNRWIRRERIAYTIWGNGRCLNAIYSVLDGLYQTTHFDAWMAVDEVMRFQGIKWHFANARAVMDKLDDSPSGVVAFGSTDKTLYTIIHHEVTP